MTSISAIQIVVTEKLMDYSYGNKSGDINIIPVRVDLSRIPASNGAKSRSGWSKIQEIYGTVQPNLALVLLFENTEAEWGKLRSFGKSFGFA